MPIVELILKHFPEVYLSIDTFRSAIADAALSAGAAMINDISGGHLDAKMLEVVAKHQVPFIAMHMKGTPQTMKNNTQYKNLLTEVQYYFSAIAQQCVAHKINDLVLDPGFGFAKTTEQNYFLLKNLAILQAHEKPILVGVSRKSMIYKTLKSSPKEALNGTTALNTVALLNHANILRVHDVKEAQETITLVNALKNSED